MARRRGFPTRSRLSYDMEPGMSVHSLRNLVVFSSITVFITSILHHAVSQSKLRAEIVQPSYKERYTVY